MVAGYAVGKSMHDMGRLLCNFVIIIIIIIIISFVFCLHCESSSNLAVACVYACLFACLLACLLLCAVNGSDMVGCVLDGWMDVGLDWKANREGIFLGGEGAICLGSWKHIIVNYLPFICFDLLLTSR